MKIAPVIFRVKSGALAIAVHKYEDARYGFEWTPTGRDRIRIRRRTRESAIAEARKLVGNAGKLDFLSIDPAEFTEFLKWKSTRRRAVTVAEMADRYIATKRTKGLSQKHLKDLEGTLREFARLDANISDLTREQVEAWLDARKVGPRRWNNQLTHIVSLLRFARRDGALSSEPHPVEHIERRKTTTKKETYTVAQFARMLLAAEPRDRVTLVLCGLCGVRPQEVRPDHASAKTALAWEHFDWKRGVIDLPASCAKTGERRFVPLCDAAAAFLAPWVGKRGECASVVGSKDVSTRVALASGVQWLPDALRHSYASYRLALIKDMQKLSLEMGNSPAMIRRHYLDLKHEDEAARWFSLRPHNLKEFAK